MALILLATAAAAVLASKLLLDAGLHSMPVRFVLAVLLAYGVFFVAVRIWLAYVRSGAGEKVDAAEAGVDAGEYAVDAAADAAEPSALEGLGDLAPDEGCGCLLVVAVCLAGLLIFVVLGYLIWQAPVILAEIAFETLLASSLVRAARRIDDPGWTAGVFRTTLVPFLIVAALSFVAGVVAAEYAPEAVRLADLLK